MPKHTDRKERGTFHLGRLCPHHPELRGKRYSNNTCPGCARDRHARNRKEKKDTAG